MFQRRRFITSVGVAVGVCVAVGFGFAPVVRGRIAAIARARRLDVSVGSITPGWFAVSLNEVRVAPVGVPVEVLLHRVRVGVGLTFSLNRVDAHRVEVRINGSPETVESALREWAGPRSSLPRAESAKVLPVSVDGLSLVWLRTSGGEPLVEVSGGSIERSNLGWRAEGESARVRGGALSVDAAEISVRANRAGALEEVRLSRVSLAWTGEAGVSAASTASSSDPAPPPLPLAASTSPPDDADAQSAARLRLPELGGLRIRMAALAAVVRDHVAEGARIDAPALSLEIGEGSRRLAIGRGPLSASRTNDSFDATFTTQRNASGTPVSLSARLPLGPGDAVVSFDGGPISLALLGFEEGAAGLVEVGRTTVSGHGRASMPPAGDAITFDGELSVGALAFNRPAIANEVVRGIDATLVARGVIDQDGSLRLDDGEISLGALHLVAHGSIEQRPDHVAASLGFELPTTRCQALLQSVPSALVPTLDGSEITGTLGAQGRLVFDSRKLDDLLLDWKVEDLCSMSSVPEALAQERFRQPFEHTVYLPDGTLAEETTGPTTTDWTELDRVSPFMQVAVLTTEDGAFYRHHGFNRGAIRNALVADLKAGRFVRGASTITMQLAKNLFLFRDKTLSRKLEEIVLADYVEQTFTKKELMELYLNVIEFGPDLYGIGKAAFHYFGRKPDELNLAESLFLASLLPAPLRFCKLAEKPRLSDGWMSHLHQLMAIAAKNDLISPEELAAGLNEDVVFHDEKDPLPPPRVAVTGTYFKAPNEEGQGEWQATPAP
jgi:hypothetical protein